MSTEDLINVVLILAPGFVALKIFQHFGTQRKRSEWEWTVWSIIVGAVIAVIVAAVPIDFLANDATVDLGGGISFGTSGVLERFTVAVVVGFAFVALWRAANMRGIPALGRLTRRLTNSAWDHVLDEAAAQRFGLEVVMDVGDATDDVRFYGSIGTFAHERDEAEPWVYVQCVEAWDAAKSAYAQIPNTDGVLIHRNQIKWMRVTRAGLPPGCEG
jgi:hypothetical protein